MVDIEKLTPNGWIPCSCQETIHAAVNDASDRCKDDPSTFRILRNNDLICLVRPQGIIWINANFEVMGEAQPEQTLTIWTQDQVIRNDQLISTT